MSWIKTFTGKHFNYANPKMESICIEDIAQALSHECRFAGHLPEFYSVAQHCVLVSQIVPVEFALEALLHDACEAYCKDIPSPLKKLIPDYCGIENSIDFAIRHKFGLPATNSPAVKHADLVLLATERRDLDIDDEEPWPMLAGIEPSKEILVSPVNPIQARTMFMQRYQQLYEGRVMTTDSTKYIVIQQSAWCNDSSSGIYYSSDLVEFDKRDKAIKHGLKQCDCDDFNIGVLVDGCLTSLDWMNEVVDNKPEILAEISEHLCIHEATPAPAVPDDYFTSLVVKARLSADKAIVKYPQPNYVLLKVAEEAGEVVQAAVHYAENRMSWEQVEGEIVQLMAMLIRLVTEGDQVNGITPPDTCRAAALQPGNELVSHSYKLPPGYKLVPADPTPKQWAAGIKAMDYGIDKVTLVYRAMVTEAPKPEGYDE